MNNKFIHNKRLDPVKVKARQLELRRQGKPYKNKDIAKAVDESEVQVCIHIAGQRSNETIQQKIADFLQVPLRSLFAKSEGSTPKRNSSVRRPSSSSPGERGSSSLAASSAAQEAMQ